MRIVVIDGHPDAGSYGEAVARSYVEGAESGGHEVRFFRLRDLTFNPILHGGFKTPQPWSRTSSRLVTLSGGASSS
jgi:putative NADPH-quinone reductase